jgi:HlyD family secretion protein
MIALGLAIGAGGVLAYQLKLASWFAGDDTADGVAEAASGAAAQTPSSSASESEFRKVSALGHLEPAAGVINITSPLIGERIQKVDVEEGQAVVAGQELVHVDPKFLQLQKELADETLLEAQRQLDAERALAKARFKAAETAVAQAGDDMSEQRAAQQAQLDTLLENRKQAELDLQRITKLVEREEPLASPQKLEHQRLSLTKTDAEISAAKAALARLERTIRIQKETAVAEKDVAKAAMDAALNSDPTGGLMKQRDLAQERLNQTKVLAPGEAVVLKVFAHAGEFLAQKPLLQLANLNEMVCVAEVFDGDIKHIRKDQRVEIRSRAFSGDFADTFVTGTVQRIGNMVKTPELQRLDPYAPVDRHVIDVDIQLDADNVTKAAKLVNKEKNAMALVNLQVEVTFLGE